MKATINVEFSDDELRKYAEDVGRRWVVNFFEEAFKTGKKLKIPPGFVETLVSAFASGAAIGEKATSDSRPDPGPVAGTAPPHVHSGPHECFRIEASPAEEEGWLCCRCSHYNGVYREMCRSCGHERCDIVVSPPPPPRQDDPSVQ